MKKFLITILGLLICTVSTACDFSFNGSDGEIGVKLTELPVPEINQNSYDQSTNTVSWASISNCDGYTVKVDNKEYNTTALSYTVSFSESKDFTFAIKARGKSLYTSDSSWSEVFTWRYTKTSGDNVSSLDFPKNIDYKDGKITWDAVEKASYYEVEISENDSTVTYNRSTNYIDVHFPNDTNFSYRVRSAKDSGGSVYYSSWSAEQTAEYKKPTSKATFNKEYSDKGLGKTVDLINGSYNEVLIGSSSIFDENKLSKLYVSTNNIKSGHQVTYWGDSMEHYIDDYTREIGAKVSISKIKPGQKKLVSQKSLSLDLGYDNNYNKRTEEETKYYFYTFMNSWMDEEIYFDAYRNSTIISNALSDQFLSDASTLQSDLQSNSTTEVSNQKISNFINRYGTHLITDAIFGAKLSVDYSLIGTQASVTEKSKNEVKVDLGISKSYWEGSANLNLNIDSNKYNSSNDVISNLSVNFMGGKNVGFVFDKNDLNGFASSYKTWADSTNDSKNNVLIDVRDNSLYCIWDLLDGSKFGFLKGKLDDYFNKAASDSYGEYSKKINNLIKNEDNTKDESETTIQKNNLELENFEFSAKIKTESKEQGTVNFKVTGFPVIYKDEEYIYGNAYYAGSIAGGSRFNDVDRFSIIAPSNNILFGGQVSWSGSKGVTEEAGVFGWDSSYAHNASEASYLHASVWSDFPGNEEVKIAINGICVKTNRKLSKDVNEYPEVTTSSFYTDLYTGEKNQGRIKFDAYGIKVAFEKKEYLFGTAYYVGNTGGSYYTNCPEMSLRNSSTIILNGGTMVYRGDKNNRHTCGVLTGEEIKNNSSDICKYITENGDYDFGGATKNYISLTNVCFKINDEVNSEIKYPVLEESTLKVRVYAESTYEGYVTFNTLGISVNYLNKEYLYGYSNFKGYFEGNRVNDCDTIKFAFDEKNALMGGNLAYHVQNNDWNTEGNLTSYIQTPSQEFIYYAWHCEDDFPGKDATDVRIAIVSCCFEK